MIQKQCVQKKVEQTMFKIAFKEAGKLYKDNRDARKVVPSNGCVNDAGSDVPQASERL